MRKAFVVLLLILVLAVTTAAGYQRGFIQDIFFTDVGGNNALATIAFERDSSDNPELQFQFTTSDTEMYTFPGTVTSAITVGQVQVACTVLEVAGMLDQSCFIADKIYTVTAITVIYTISEGSGTLTLIPRKQEGVEAAASGQALANAVDMTATAETLVTATLTSTGADLILAVGDRLGLDFTDDTAGVLAGLVVTFTLNPS